MKTQEQSSTSNQKIITPNKELIGVKKSEKAKLPNPTGWRMLVLPFRMSEKSKGGVLFANETVDRQQVASQCGNVLAMGPDCYNDKNRFKDGPWCKVGDWVIFARYAGSRIEIEGGEVRLLNDDEVLATVQDPTDILHKFYHREDTMPEEEEEEKEEDTKLEEYSKGVQNRIAKLTRKMREAERREQAAVEYAAAIESKRKLDQERFKKVDSDYNKRFEENLKTGMDAAQKELALAIEQGDAAAQVEAFS